jgi:hypothetical protein
MKTPTTTVPTPPSNPNNPPGIALESDTHEDDGVAGVDVEDDGNVESTTLLLMRRSTRPQELKASLSKPTKRISQELSQE